MTTTATTTATAPPLEQSVLWRTTLRDYELHQTTPGHTEERPRLHLSTSDTPSTRLGTNQEWQLPHRRVPSVRPVNQARDQSEVRVYLNRAEQAFVTIMFTGLFVNAVSGNLNRWDTADGCDN